MDEQENLKKTEEKHIRTLSNYLDNYHNYTGYSNKKVSEILDLDRSYYNKIRLKQISPITNSILILKKFAALNNENLVNFICKIEEIKSEDNSIQNFDPIIQKALLKRIKSLSLKKDLKRNDCLYIFTLIILILEISESKSNEFIESFYRLALNFHDVLGLKKEKDLIELIENINKIENNT